MKGIWRWQLLRWTSSSRPWAMKIMSSHLAFWFFPLQNRRSCGSESRRWARISLWNSRAMTHSRCPSSNWLSRYMALRGLWLANNSICDLSQGCWSSRTVCASNQHLVDFHYKVGCQSVQVPESSLSSHLMQSDDWCFRFCLCNLRACILAGNCRPERVIGCLDDMRVWLWYVLTIWAALSDLLSISD